MRARHAARGRARGVVAGVAAVVWWLVSGAWAQGVGESVEEGDVYVEDGYLTWGECEWS